VVNWAQEVTSAQKDFEEKTGLGRETRERENPLVADIGRLETAVAQENESWTG
jgi:hypothetical protein